MERRVRHNCMRVAEAKELVLEAMALDLRASGSLIPLEPHSPDPRDPGKFVIGGKVARAIHFFSGWFAPIDLNWFSGGYDPPVINGSPFYWYAFAIPRGKRYRRDHYLLCDYLQIRAWVLDFDAPLGNDHRDHNLWRADLRVFVEDPLEKTGYFRWGDEPIGTTSRPGRVFRLDNVTTITDATLAGVPVGAIGPGGESAAHRLLKLYVAGHPVEFGLTAVARPSVEYGFQTGDRVDVLFENHEPDRTVVEVEVAGEQNICVGIHQAVKYRSLAEIDVGFPANSGHVGSIVVAYETNYGRAHDLADRYDISLISVDRRHVLQTAV